jgi:putative methyltransferase (TIGR04325 family)
MRPGFEFYMEWKQLILENIRKIKPSRYGWKGDYTTWEAAKEQAGSYDDGIILEKVQRAALQVKHGEAAYERDSVAFDKVEYSWPLLAALMWVAAKNKGRLTVADFGGSMGSSYFQNRIFLDSLQDLKWYVIEQPHFVQRGNLHFKNEKLEFFESLDHCVKAKGTPDVLVLSCVLPYLEKPYDFLDKISDFEISHVIIDNTYFNFEKRDRICVQTVPPDIYEASYPCWLLSHENVIQSLEKHYRILSEHKNDSAIYIDGKKIIYEGFLALRTK